MMSCDGCPQTHGPVLVGVGRRAVFLDRDGVLIADTGYPDDPRAISLLSGVGEALRRLREAGWRLVVVTNQSGVARGRFSLARLAAIHTRLAALLAAEGVCLDALYFCPHHPEGVLPAFRRDCDHRKPAPGMLRSAAEAMRLCLAECWLVGDKESDIEAARAAGCRAVLVSTPLASATQAEAVVADLSTAVARILA